MKKLISLLISAALVFGLCAPFSAYADGIEVQNPLYAHSSGIKPLRGGNVIFMEDSVSAKYKGCTYYTKGRQLYNSVKPQLEKRKENVTIRCLSKDKMDIYSATNSIVYFCYLGATDDELSVSSTDGDYLRWVVRSFVTQSAEKDTKKNGYNYYTVKVKFRYYDTAAEEKKVDSAVNSYLNSHPTSGKTDFQIIKEVHDYICNKNIYSEVAADSPEDYPYAFCAYGTLVKGRSVCQGYAAAFYRICKELGYKVRFVSSDPDWGCHAWNIIRLDNKYYTVDCTWDDQTVDSGDNEVEPYYYFLTTAALAQEYDSILGEHKLYSSIYDTNYFETNYKQYFADDIYVNNSESQLSSCSVSLSSASFTYSGKEIKPAVTVKNGNAILREGTHYSVSYSSDINTGLARVNVTGKGSYAKSSTHRTFKIIPSAVNGLKYTENTTNSVKLRWNKNGGAVSGYEVQYYSGGKWVTALNTSANSCTVSSLSKAEKYSFRVRAYKTVNKHNYYGAFSSYISASTKPAKVKIKSVSAGKKSITLNWKKVKSSGYQLQYSTKKSMKGSKKLSVKAKKDKRKIKKLKTGKTYYIRIRSYKKYKNEKGKTKYAYGKWSAKKAVKVK